MILYIIFSIIKCVRRALSHSFIYAVSQISQRYAREQVSKQVYFYTLRQKKIGMGEDEMPNKQKKIVEILVVVILALFIVAAGGVTMHMMLTNTVHTNENESAKTKVKKGNKNADAMLQDTLEEVKLSDFSVGFDQIEYNDLQEDYEEDSDSETDEMTEDSDTESITTENTTTDEYADGNSKDYIIYDSDSRYLTEEDLENLTKDELSLARNEIYARHGRIFDTEELQTYFDNKDWYEPLIDADSFEEEMLNEYEKANVKFIRKFEKQLN